MEFLGFAVVEAESGQEAYESAMCYQPDLILMELKLPVVNGFSAIRRIKKDSELTNIPIIAMSSRSGAENRNFAIAAGCSAHVQKPIEFDRLESVVEELVQCDKLSLVSTLVH